LVLLTACVAALVGGAVGAVTVGLTAHRTSNVNVGLGFTTQSAPAPKLDGSVSAAAAKIRPSVVTIDVASSSEADTGSGVIIRADGYILTNNHVVATAAGGGSIVVTLADGRRAAGTIVGTDKSDDLAVVRVNLPSLRAASFASSSTLVVGQTVVAVGAPLGLSDTVTSGIVSSTARPVSTGTSQTSLAVFDAVQTDAAINPGNSGGPLVDLNGSVVGINAAIATDSSQGGLQIPGQSSQSGNIGIGFAIPSDEASRIAGELIATGKASHALLGVSVSDPAATTSATAPVGAVVTAVKAGSPAAQAGMKIGDLVTLVAAQRIDSADALVAAVRSHAPRQTVGITYLRAGASHSIRVTLGTSPS
jgi:putative serine protease PepD